MRSRAILAQTFSSSGTTMWLTTCPSARFSIAQQRWGASMRNIVAHWQTVEERKNPRLSGWVRLSRLTRFSSVPTAQAVPAGAALTVLMMNSVEPTRSARFTTRSEEHTSELQSQSNLVCRLLLEKKKRDRYETTAKRLEPGITESHVETLSEL